MTDQQKRHWDAVADGWEAWLDWTERNFRPVTAWLGAAAAWKPGARILDVACGAGYPALAAAAAVRPGGLVVGVDLSPAMIAAAARRATAAGLDNAEFIEMDAASLRFDDEVFNAVTNTYGLMFCPDPQRVVDESRRVLEPGGRCAFVTWDEPSRNPFFTVITGVAATFLALRPPERTGQGPFRFAPAGKLESLLRASGFSDVRIDSVPMTVECASAAEYCQIFTDVAWKSRIAALSASDADLFRNAVAEAAAPYIDGGRLRLVATSLCASARK